MTTMLQIPAADMYVLVSWPAVQLLMRHEWFDMECVAYYFHCGVF